MRRHVWQQSPKPATVVVAKREQLGITQMRRLGVDMTEKSVREKSMADALDL